MTTTNTEITVLIDQPNTIINTDDGFLTRIEALKKVLGLAIPASGARLISVTAEFASFTMLSRLGTNYLAANGLIVIFLNSVLTNMALALYATSDLASKESGANRKHEVGKILNASYTLAFLMSIPATVILVLSGSILKALQQPEAPAEIVEEYFRAFAMLGGVQAMLLDVSSQQACYVLDKKSLVVASSVLRRVIYLPLAYGFIYGQLGMPELRAKGLGYAAAISTWITQIAFMIYFKFNRDLANQFHLFQHPFFDSVSEWIGKISSRALQLGLQASNEFIANFINTLYMGYMGVNTLAASEITMQYMNLFFIPIMNFMQSAAILIGKNKERPKDAIRIGNVAIASGLLIPTLSLPFFMGMPQLLSKVFIKKNELSEKEAILETTKKLFMLASPIILFMAQRNISSGSLRGLGHYYFPLAINIFSITLLGLTLSYLLGFHTTLGPVGIMLGSLMANLLASVLTYGRWNSVSARVIENNNADIVENFSATVCGFFRKNADDNREISIHNRENYQSIQRA